MKRFSFVLILSILALIPTLTHAGWWRTYGQGSGVSLQQTPDGGFFVAGNYLGDDALMLKTDSIGLKEWLKTYDNFTCNSGCITSDGGYIITGKALGPGDEPGTKLIVTKTDSQGDELWTYVLGEGLEPSELFEGLCVQETKDGGYIVLGDFSGGEALLSKIDSLGHEIWSRGPEYAGVGKYMGLTIDGGCIVTGMSNSSLWLLKTDSLGDSLWAKIYGREGWDGGSWVEQTSDSGYIIAGYSEVDEGRTWPSDDLWLLKTDSLGDTIWTRTYGEEGSDKGHCVKQTSDGGYIVAGRPWTLLKTDSLGDSLWSRDYGMIGREVQETSDGCYIVVGSKDGELCLIKTDSLGLLAIEEPVTPATQPDWQILTPIGHHITLRAPEGSPPLDLAVFDASGRKVDEIRLSSENIIWGEGFTPGVYFIGETSGYVTPQKVILVR